MRAARLHTIGGPLQLDEAADPADADGNVIVEMAYASVNPLDVWVTRGAPGTAADHLPWTPGTEGAGYVDGRAVLVRGDGLGVMRPGLYCEKASVPTGCLTDIPDGVDLAQAAAIGVAGITAWQAVNAKAQVTADDRVLVLGASGGVGSFAVQLAAAAGAEVWGQTGSAAKVDGIASMGAARAVVADAESLGAAVTEFQPTVVLDSLGGAFTDVAIGVLAPRGRLVVYGTSVDEVVTVNLRTMYRKGVTILGYTGLIGSAAEERDVIDELLSQVAAGQLRVPIGAVLSLAQAGEAHRRIVDREVEGKIVLDCRA